MKLIEKVDFYAKFLPSHFDVNVRIQMWWCSWNRNQFVHFMRCLTKSWYVFPFISRMVDLFIPCHYQYFMWKWERTKFISSPKIVNNRKWEKGNFFLLSRFPISSHIQHPLHIFLIVAAASAADTVAFLLYCLFFFFLFPSSFVLSRTMLQHRFQ